MKKQFIIILFLLILFSCKKETTTTNNNTVLPPSQELSAPLFETEYGNCYDYEDIGNNPLTFLPSGDMIISSIQYNGMIDKLQISKVNASGNLVWQKNFTQGYKFKSGKSFVTSTGDVIVIGALVNAADWVYSKTFIAKLNPTTGDTIWTRTYGYNYIDRGVVGYEDLNQNYWVVDFNNQNSKATLIKIAPNGDSLTSILNPEINQPQYRDALITNSNEIILVGESGTFTSSKQPVYICKYTGGVRNFASNIELNSYDQINVTDVCQTSDGNYVVSGSCQNFSNPGPRYGFLLKVDNNGNKIWEHIVTQFNESGIYACTEKSTDVFYISIGDMGSANIFEYDLNNLMLVNVPSAPQPDAQLLIKNGKLYRTILGTTPSYYETVKLKVYTIN